MSRAQAALGASLLAVGLGFGWIWWNVRRDDGALEAAWEQAAADAADSLRVAAPRGEGAAAAARFEATRHFRVTVMALDRVPAAERAALIATDAPRPATGGVLAPLKDEDGWDIVAAVKVEPLAGAPAGAPLARVAVLLPLALLLAGCAWFLRWNARAAERRRRETLVAWSFLGAPFLHLAVFSFAPVLFTFYLSLHRWDLVSSARPFVGLANYRQLAADREFWVTLRNTAVYVLYVPVTMACALGLALLLNRRRTGEALLRAVVFMPYVTSTVAVALVWQWLMNADFGLVNHLLQLVGLPAIDWLGSPRTALLSIIIVTVWTQVGYQMIVLLAGLQGLPQAYLDAALVDGASPWQRFVHVTVPLLKPVLLFVLVTGIISGFQVFTLVYLMTEGGPLHATDVLVYRIYQAAWEFLRFGSASAMAVVLFAILLAVTIVQFRLLGRRIEHV